MAQPRQFLVALDLTKNQLLNAALQNLPSDPTSPVDGQIYWNTTDKKPYIYDLANTVWLDLLGGAGYTHPTFTAFTPDVTGANVLSTFTTNTEGHVTAASSRVLTLADLGYTPYAHPTGGTLAGAPLTGALVIDDVTVDGEGHVTAFSTRSLTASDIGAVVINDAATNGTETWSSTKISNEIANAISGGMNFIGGYNASTNSPDLDTAPSGILQGDTYVISTGGTFFSEDVQVGDMIIAQQNDPTTLAHWVVVNKNIDDIVSATTLVEGLIQLATQAEVDTGSNAVKAVTPATLKGHLDAYGLMLRYAETIGNGALTDFTITHSLNSQDVMVRVIEVATNESVEADVSSPTVNTVSVKFNAAPASNEYRVVVIG